MGAEEKGWNPVAAMEEKREVGCGAREERRKEKDGVPSIPSSMKEIDISIPLLEMKPWIMSVPSPSFSFVFFPPKFRSTFLSFSCGFSFLGWYQGFFFFLLHFDHLRELVSSSFPWFNVVDLGNF